MTDITPATDDGDQIPAWMRYKARAEKAEAERDAAVAQVAVLVRIATGEVCHSFNDLCPDPVNGYDSRDTQNCEACRILANLPAAAARYLAAEAACQAILPIVANRDPGAYGVAADVETELAEWRKAGGR